LVDDIEPTVLLRLPRPSQPARRHVEQNHPFLWVRHVTRHGEAFARPHSFCCSAAGSWRYFGIPASGWRRGFAFKAPGGSLRVNSPSQGWLVDPHPALPASCGTPCSRAGGEFPDRCTPERGGRTDLPVVGEIECVPWLYPAWHQYSPWDS